MTYPSRDDFLDRDRRERDADDGAPADAQVAEFERTGLCPRWIQATDPVRAYCPVCQHAETLHPGYVNPDPEVTGCVMCHLKRMVALPLPPPARAIPAYGCCPDYPICSH